MLRRKASTRTTLVRQRAREVGVGLPDFSAPSAHREAELSPEMVKAADEFYAELQKSVPTEDESGDAQSAAEDLAEAENRRLITLDV